MPRVLFIHSAGSQGPGEGSSRFLDRLRSALGADAEIVAPPMPTPESPDALPWLEATARYVAGMAPPFALLGHSLGGSIILKHLAEQGVPAGLTGVVTVAAPFWGAPGWDYKAFALPHDAGERLKDMPAITLLFGRQDEVVSVDHLDLYQSAIPTATGRLVDGDHEFASGDIAAVADAIRSLPGFGSATTREAR